MSQIERLFVLVIQNITVKCLINIHILILFIQGLQFCSKICSYLFVFIFETLLQNTLNLVSYPRPSVSRMNN